MSVLLVALVLFSGGLAASDDLGTLADSEEFIPQDLPAYVDLQQFRTVTGGGTDVRYDMLLTGPDLRDPKTLRWMEQHRQVATDKPLVEGMETPATLVKEYNGGEIPETDVLANEMLPSVFRNLLNNAVLHNDKSEPEITVHVEDNGDTAMVRIADNGPGIPEHELDVLERGHETELRHSSGLGLWFVHWVVDASNGRLTFDQNSPRGSVVEVHLPSTTASATDRLHDESRRDAVSGDAPSASNDRDEPAVADR